MENEVSTKTLLIGCGGSGIKTLLRLNAMMSSDANVRDDMAETISYFVLDTDGGDLENFEKMIKLQMGFATPPTVAKAHLTDGYHKLNEMVSPNFDNKPEEAIAKLKKYWWFREDGVPFRGEDITDLQSGAGQCPQVSYLATWNYMSKIEEIVNELLINICNNNQNEANPLANLRVYIVAGFAGGTGRGSWTLVAFKIRECLLRRKLNIPIDGIFFDASCYPNVKDDEERKSLHVNSATAISELSSWIRLKKVQNSEYFTLPSLNNPLNADAINFDKFGITDSSLLAPIQSAYVVFGSNGATAPLPNNDHYHNMAAAALYARIVHSQNTSSKDANKRSNIGSFASTTFEVDSIRIQAYLETAVQKTFLAQQSAQATPEMIQQVEAAVGKIENPAPESFLGKNQLWIPQALTFNETYNSMDAKTSLLGTIMELIAKKDDSFTIEDKKELNVKELKLTSGLREVLDSQDAEEIKNYAETTFQLTENLDDNAIKSLFNQFLSDRKLDDANRTATLRKLVMDQFAPEGDAVVSLRRAMLFVDGLIKAFTAYKKSLANGVTVDNNKYPDVSKLIEAFKNDVDSKSGKTLSESLNIFTGKPFNPDEIEELCRKFQYFIPAAVFFRIKGLLTTFITQFVNDLDNIKKSLDKMILFLQEASKKLDANVTTVFEDTPFDDIFDVLFTDSEKPESILDSIPKRTDQTNLYYRNLKPIWSRAELNEALTDPDNYFATKPPIMECFKEELANLMDLTCKVKVRTYNTDDDAWDLIPEKVSTAVMANVGLKVDPSGGSFTNRYFSFEKVLDKNIEAWNKLLNDTPQTVIDRLFDQFKAYLGLDKNDYEENRQTRLKNRISKKKLIQKMVLSLVSTCNPWIELAQRSDSSVKQPLTCLVILPFDISNDVENLKQIIQNRYKALDYNLSLEILHSGSEIAKKLPQDRILVYNSELLGFESKTADGAPVEKILSVDYWKEYRELLELAEDLKHDSSALFMKEGSMYDGQWVERERSFAYLAPFFTMAPFKKLRWHPWIKEDVDMEKARLEEINKVLFYAFLGHALAGKESEIAAAKEAVKSFGCSMPLLEMGKDKHPELFHFLREPLEWGNGKMTEAMRAEWHTGDELENSINHVVEFLNEEGYSRDRAEGGKRLQASIEAGAKIRTALLAEAEAFFANIPGHIGAVHYKEIVRQCCFWIRKEKEDSKDPDDQQYWEPLFNFATNELNKLG